MSEPLHLVGLIESADLPILAPHRAATGWEMLAADRSRFWLRVPTADADDFSRLPLSGRWSADGAGQLVRLGKRVPDQIVPMQGWQPVAVFLPVGLPARGSVGMPPAAVAFRLEQHGQEPPTGALMCRWTDFAAWATDAFAPRLNHLRFACCDDGRVFVTGQPLPPVRGGGFYQIGRLWLPCGWCLPDHVWPELVEELLRLGTSRLALLHADGSYEELPEENFVAASRVAVRLSARDPLSIGEP